MSKSDYVERAIEYAKEALKKKNKKKFGNLFKLGAKRFLNDLKRAKKKNGPFTFSTWHANDVCEFIELLPHVEGTWETENITLHVSDVFFLVNLFGFRDREGGRRFTTALKAIARKNAKSTIAAAISIYCQVKENEVGPQVISGATTYKQAEIVFNIAKRMVEKTTDLQEAFGMEAFSRAIASFCNGGTFKAITNKANTHDGLNPSCSTLDEIHAHKNGDLINVIRSAAGARRNPLFLFTTTEGYESPGPWGEQRHFAKQVLKGIVEADHFLVVYYAVDEKDDDFDESIWIKANPLMECNEILIKEIRKEAIEAKAMPGKLPEFKIKRLNRQSSTSQGWIKFDDWKKCESEIDFEWLAQYPCYGGLDLASTSDLCSFRLVWCIDGKYYTWGRRWVPADAVKLRTTRGSVPYEAWVKAGYIEQTPGPVTDFNVVKEAVVLANENLNIQAIGYDSWNAAQLVAKLVDEEVPMVQFIQGPKSYHPAMQEFERSYVSQNLVYPKDPVLTWCASNLIVRYDANLNMAPDKKKSPDKIDDMVALLMAIGVCIKPPEEEQHEHSGDLGIM